MTVLNKPSLASFTSFSRITQGWYIVGRSSSLAKERVKSVQALNRKLALFRDETGVVRALDARCPHLGADLGQGEVVGNSLQCPFHHWQFDGSGTCVHAPEFINTPKRFTRTYPVQEKWGFLWLYNGPVPLFRLPHFPSTYRTIRFPAQHIACHPHLVIGNGLDASHFEALHGMTLTAEPVFEQKDAYTLELTLKGKPVASWLQHLTGTNKKSLVARFVTLGGNLAWIEVTQPLPFYALFTGRPSARNGCDTQTLLFVPRNSWINLPRILLLLLTLLRDDRKILEWLDFKPGYTEKDEALKTFAQLIDSLPIG